MVWSPSGPEGHRPARRSGEHIVVCGPSGSGKSTLIRCINHLERNPGRPNLRQRHRTLGQKGANLDRDSPRCRHGVPAVQPVPASDRARELHAGAALRAQGCRGRGRGTRDAPTSSACASPSRRDKYPRAAFGRPAAARGDRPRALHGPEDHAVRRADLGARSRDGQGSARHDDRARRRRHDHDLRHP